uniref:Uncharacterized protein n=1 Tax=Glossina pallidipes TaxID=7398 RepID=A0A1B0A8X6_GLOPL
MQSALPLVTATTFCFTYKWKWLIIASYCLMSLWGLYKALTASSPWQRRLCFALPFTMRSILTFLRTLGVVGGNDVALPHVYLQINNSECIEAKAKGQQAVATRSTELSETFYYILYYSDRGRDDA